MGLHEDIAILESDMPRLKIEYEQYFMRVIKREPLKLRESIERIIRRNSNAAITNTGDKFKFQSLVAKYTSYKQYWTRTLKAVENGTYHRRSEGGAASAPSAPDAIRPPERRTVSSDGGGGAGNGEDKAKKVFDEFLSAKKECNESTEGLSFESFNKSLNAQRDKLKASGGASDVDFKVSVKDGKTKVSFAAKK